MSKQTKPEQGDGPDLGTIHHKMEATVQEVRVLALDKDESARHRQWLVDREQQTTADHRQWTEGVMEKDRKVQRQILAELRGIRRLLEDGRS